MGLRSRLMRTFRSGRYSDDIAEELQFHLDMDVAEGRAPREARMRLGNRTRIEEDTRAMGIIEWLDSAHQDVRYGVRQLRKTPAMTLAVLVTSTVGIRARASGANSRNAPVV
jgi:hypothetical protein